MKKILTSILLLLLGLFFNEALAGQSKNHLYSIEDVLAFKRIGQVSASPDGKQVAFTVFQVQPTLSGKRWEYSLLLKDQQGKIHLLAKKRQISH